MRPPTRRGDVPYEDIMLDRTAEEISDARPEISPNLLANDEEAVRASLPAVRYAFAKRGLTYRQADQLAFYGWKQLRTGRLDSAASLSPKTLIEFIDDFEMLTITSTPSGARIEIDGKLQSDKTNNTSYASHGIYRIKLSLNGYEPAQGTCEVKENEPAVFDRTLKKISPNE